MAPRSLPIACSLGADQLPARLETIRGLGCDGLLHSSVNGRTAHLSFRAGVRARVEAVVAAEARCCAFLEMSLEAAPDGAVELRIEAPPGGETAMRELVDAFGPGAHASAHGPPG